MITKSMTLNSMADARQWASEFGVDDAAEGRLSIWIWQRKPYIGVAYGDHPFSILSENEFWEICERGYLTLSYEEDA